MKKKKILIITAIIFASIILTSFLSEDNESVEIPSRESKIPVDAVKMTPETDKHPPITVSDEYEPPMPLPYPINTKGAEDSAFIMPDGNTLYLWFTPDTKGDVHAQAVDLVTGIYVAKKVNEQWQNPERVWLIEPGKAVLDGCEFVVENTMWFCSVREGYTGMHWFTAEVVDGKWSNWENADFDPAYEVGELHIHENDLYFHSPRPGKGEYDIWVSTKTKGEWGEPENIAIVNSEYSDGWPWISLDGEEMWFTRLEGAPNLYRSKKVDGQWTEPELMIKTLAGEASLDSQGNVYFTHHYYDDEGNMLESDIYVAYRKQVLIPTDAPELPSRGFFKGLMPIPGDGQSFEEVHQEVSHSVDFVPVWGQPTPFYELATVLNGSWGQIFVEDLIRGKGMFPLVHLSFMEHGVTLAVPPGIENATLSDRKWRESYKNAALDVVRVAQPRYLSLGNEVNRWYEKYGADERSSNGFQHFVSLYEEIYDAVKELSPETIVFCVFAREIVAELREADLEVLSLFNPEKIDVLVFTSYPHSVRDINRPEDIPDNYYKKVFNYFPDKPFGFSELAWPSLEAFGGEPGQAAFLTQVTSRLTEVQSMDLHLLGWSWLHDIEENDYAGLKNRDGSEKMACEVWENT